jgi:hypothetical protein
MPYRVARYAQATTNPLLPSTTTGNGLADAKLSRDRRESSTSIATANSRFNIKLSGPPEFIATIGPHAKTRYARNKPAPRVFRVNHRRSGKDALSCGKKIQATASGSISDMIG